MIAITPVTNSKLTTLSLSSLLNQLLFIQKEQPTNNKDSREKLVEGIKDVERVNLSFENLISCL